MTVPSQNVTRATSYILRAFDWNDRSRWFRTEFPPCVYASTSLVVRGRKFATLDNAATYRGLLNALYASARNSNGLRSVMFTRFFRSEIEVVDSGKPNRVSVAVRIHNFFHKPASAIYVPVKVQFRSRS